MSETWVTSANRDDWSSCEFEYPSCEKAIEAGPGDLMPGDAYFVGRQIPFLPSIDADQIIEQLECDANEHAGEYADGWPDASKAARDDLQSCLDDLLKCWIADYKLQPHFWQIEDITEHAWPSEPSEDES